MENATRQVKFVLPLFSTLIDNRIMEKYVSQILAPRIKGDGGWVEFISYEEGILTLGFRGECSKCLILHRCTAWIESEIKKNLGVSVTVEPKRLKPYFWDQV